MSIVIQPADSCAVAEICELAECPSILSNCGRNCFEVWACKDTLFKFDLGCNIFTGDDVETGDLTEFNIKIYHDTDDGVVIDKVYSLADDAGYFVAASVYQYNVTLPGSETAGLLSGALIMEVSVVTAEGEWKIYEFTLCVEKELLAPPIMAVTGSGDADDAFFVVAGLVDLFFHNSDIVHNGKEWDRFEILWGDGTALETIDVSANIPLTSAIATAQHTYAASGTYTLTINGYSDLDAADACDVELTDCAIFTLCILV